MSLIKRAMKQDAVYWPPSGVKGTGKKTFGSPIEIKCRWDESSSRKYTDDRGVEQTSNAIVMVDRDLQLGGLLRLTTLTALGVDTATYADGTARYYEIKKIDKTPNLRVTEFLRECWI